jgi:hypothetical protein
MKMSANRNHQKTVLLFLLARNAKMLKVNPPKKEKIRYRITMARE